MKNQELDKINMKTLKEIQESNRRKIICAVHGTKDYKAALKAELTIGCLLSRYTIGMWGHLATESYYRITNFVKNKQTKARDLVLTCCGFQNLGESFVEEGKEDKIYLSLEDIIEESQVKLPEWGREQTVIIGRPLTLSRVLIALEPYPSNYGIIAGHIATINRKDMSYKFICKWDLTKETLEEQTEETQRAINELLTKTKEK